MHFTKNRNLQITSVLEPNSENGQVLSYLSLLTYNEAGGVFSRE